MSVTEMTIDRLCEERDAAIAAQGLQAEYIMRLITKKDGLSTHNVQLMGENKRLRAELARATDHLEAVTTQRDQLHYDVVHWKEQAEAGDRMRDRDRAELARAMKLCNAAVTWMKGYGTGVESEALIDAAAEYECATTEATP